MSRSQSGDHRARRDAAAPLELLIARGALAALLIVLAPIAASAMCGTGNAPSYDDISAVLLQVDSCGLGRSRDPVPQFLCSNFWALFSDASAVDTGPKPVAAAIYSQFNLVGGIGTYTLDLSLQDARSILRKWHFFDLSPVDIGPDTGAVTLSVKRCAVTTRIRASLMPETESQTAGLLATLMALIQDAAKHKLSSKPSTFAYDIFFGM